MAKSTNTSTEKYHSRARVNVDRSRATSVSLFENKTVQTQVNALQNNDHILRKTDVQLPALRADRISQEVRSRQVSATNSKQHTANVLSRNHHLERAQKTEVPECYREKIVTGETTLVDASEITISPCNKQLRQTEEDEDVDSESLEVVATVQDYTADAIPCTKRSTPASMKSKTGRIRSVIRDQLKRNRKESFAELMKFNLDLELAEAERSLYQVNATQQFVSKAMRGHLTQK